MSKYEQILSNFEQIFVILSGQLLLKFAHAPKFQCAQENFGAHMLTICSKKKTLTGTMVPVPVPVKILVPVPVPVKNRPGPGPLKVKIWGVKNDIFIEIFIFKKNFSGAFGAEGAKYTSKFLKIVFCQNTSNFSDEKSAKKLIFFDKH